MNRDDDGAAVLEFVFVALLLAVPLAYTAVAVVRVHAAAVTAQTSASAAALAVARGTVTPAGAQPVVRGYWGGPAASRADPQVSVTCGPRACATPGGWVAVTVSTAVDLPLLPRRWLTVPVAATQSQAVDRYAAP